MNKHAQTEQYKNTVQTIKNAVNTSTHTLPKHPQGCRTTSTYVRPHITRQVRTTTVQDTHSHTKCDSLNTVQSSTLSIRTYLHIFIMISVRLGCTALRCAAQTRKHVLRSCSLYCPVSELSNERHRVSSSPTVNVLQLVVFQLSFSFPHNIFRRAAKVFSSLY